MSTNGGFDLVGWGPKLADGETDGGRRCGKVHAEKQRAAWVDKAILSAPTPTSRTAGESSRSKLTSPMVKACRYCSALPFVRMFDSATFVHDAAASLVCMACHSHGSCPGPYGWLIRRHRLPATVVRKALAAMRPTMPRHQRPTRKEAEPQACSSISNAASAGG